MDAGEPLTGTRVQGLAAAWQVELRSTEPIDRGISSLTWHGTDVDGLAWVLKWTDEAAFLPGLGVAERLAEAGLRTGRPRRTVDGQIAVPVAGGHLALLAFEPGRAADFPEDAAAIGRMLARVHGAGIETADLGLSEWSTLPASPDELGLLDAGLSAAAQAASAEALAAATGLEHGVLHGDPDACEFLLDGDATALVDWGSALHGPFVYDVALTQVQCHADADEIALVIDAYAEVRPAIRGELEAYDAFHRFAWLFAASAWAKRMLDGTADPGPFTNRYAFERSRDIFLTGVWRP